jgi:hypothetical protein
MTTLGPNLFLVGAPKCGTTSMHHYLSQHPDIFMSSVKEPHFLSTDIDYRLKDRITEETQYYGLFSDARERRYRGESSVWYLYSDAACRRINQIAEDPRIIIMIRNPVDFIQSLHGQFCESLNETQLDLQKALALESGRAAGRFIPAESHNPLGLQYRRVAHFSPRIERYFLEHGRQRVHVIVFDDLSDDPARVYRGVLRFLGLPEVEVDFAPKNRAVDRGSRNVVLERILKRAPVIRKLGNHTPRQVKAGLHGVLDRLFGRVSLQKCTMPSDLRTELVDLFKGEVNHLSRLLGQDLSHWAR